MKAKVKAKVKARVKLRQKVKQIGFGLALALCWSLPPTASAQDYIPIPYSKVQFFDDDGAPLVGGKLYSYLGGTTTPEATYTDSTGGTPNANPVILDAAGRASIWLDTTVNYKFTLTDSDDVTIWTVDNLEWMQGPFSAFTLTDNGVLYGDGTGAIDATSAGADNTVLISAGGAPSFSSEPDVESLDIDGTLFANLGSPTAGRVTYCTDCTLTSAGSDNTCAGSGSGALAVRIGSTWRCFVDQD